MSGPGPSISWEKHSPPPLQKPLINKPFGPLVLVGWIRWLVQRPLRKYPMNGLAYDSSGGSSTPTNTPCLSSGTLLSEVKGRQCFQAVTCFTQLDSLTPKAFLIRESCIQPSSPLCSCRGTWVSGRVRDTPGIPGMQDPRRLAA